MLKYVTLGEFNLFAILLLFCRWNELKDFLSSIVKLIILLVIYELVAIDLFDYCNAIKFTFCANQQIVSYHQCL